MKIMQLVSFCLGVVLLISMSACDTSTYKSSTDSYQSSKANPDRWDEKGYDPNKDDIKEISKRCYPNNPTKEKVLKDALNDFYGKQEGVRYAKVAKWFRKPTEQGYANAQFSLGVMYQNGKGVMQNGVTAADWYYKAGLSLTKE